MSITTIAGAMKSVSKIQGMFGVSVPRLKCDHQMATSRTPLETACGDLWGLPFDLSCYLLLIQHTGWNPLLFSMVHRSDFQTFPTSTVIEFHIGYITNDFSTSLTDITNPLWRSWPCMHKTKLEEHSAVGRDIRSVSNQMGSQMWVVVA